MDPIKTEKRINKLSHIGHLIKKLREKRNMSQEVLARQAGILQPSLFRVEKNKLGGKTDILNKIAAAFDMSLSEMIKLAEK